MTTDKNIVIGLYGKPALSTLSTTPLNLHRAGRKSHFFVWKVKRVVEKNSFPSAFPHYWEKILQYLPVQKTVKGWKKKCPPVK